jgi:hypothetical protein
VSSPGGLHPKALAGRVEGRRASGRWRVSRPALSMARWVQNSTVATFPTGCLENFHVRLHRAVAQDGSVLKVEMAILDTQSNGVSIDEQSQDDVMHLCGASIMAPATPFRFYAMQKHLTIERTRRSMI